MVLMDDRRVADNNGWWDGIEGIWGRDGTNKRGGTDWTKSIDGHTTEVLPLSVIICDGRLLLPDRCVVIYILFVFVRRLIINESMMIWYRTVMQALYFLAMIDANSKSDASWAWILQATPNLAEKAVYVEAPTIFWRTPTLSGHQKMNTNLSWARSSAT